MLQMYAKTSLSVLDLLCLARDTRPHFRAWLRIRALLHGAATAGAFFTGWTPLRP